MKLQINQLQIHLVLVGNLVCSGVAFGQSTYPYPNSPLELEQESRNAKPNILLFMDNSWSMKRAFRYDPKKRERLFFSKNVAKHILAKYGNSARWGLASYDLGKTTHNRKGEPRDNSGPVHYRQGNTGYSWDYRAGRQENYANAARVGAKIIVPIGEPDTKQFKLILKGIDNLRFKWHTPMTSALYEMSRYYRGMTSAYNKPIPGKPYNPVPKTLALLENGQARYTSPIQYRCQRNMILMVTDDRPYATYNWRNLWPAVVDPHLGQHITREPFDKRHARRIHNTRNTLGLDWGRLPSGPQGQQYDNVDFAGMYTEDGGLQFISKYMNKLDMIKASDRPQGDLEGKSFDDPAFPIQTIETHFLGFDGPADQSFSRRTDLDGGSKAGWARLGRAAAFGSKTPLYNTDGSIRYDQNDQIIYGIGIFHEAKMNSSAGVIASLDAMLTEAFKSTTEYSPIPAIPMGLSDNTLVKIVSTVNVVNWHSELKFMQVKADGSLDKNRFSRVDYSKPKRILISTPEGLRTLGKTPSENGITFDNNFFGITSKLADQDEWQEKLIPWLLREQSNDQAFVDSVPPEDMITQPPMVHPGEPGYGDGGEFGVEGTKDADGYRMRDMKNSYARYLGDVIDSPLYQIGDMVKTDTTERRKYLMLGSNDGMLHIYRATESATHPYEMVFGYIPGAAPRTSEHDILLNGLRKTASPNYGSPQNPHQYFVNGEIMHRETHNGHLFMVGTLGKGGRAAYALNIDGKQYGTNRQTGLVNVVPLWHQTVPLWDTSSGSFGTAKVGTEKIGYTISRPTIGRLALTRKNGVPNLHGNIRYVSLLANGYDGTEAHPTLYVQDALGLNVGLDMKSFSNTTSPTAGKLIKAVAFEGLTDKNGLSSPVAVDLDKNGIVDVAYAGDNNGNLYRFDFRENTVDDWTVTLIFKGDGRHPITTAPEIVPHQADGKYTIIFGTGSALYESDLTDDTVQRLYGIIDDVNIKHKDIVPINVTELLEQKLVQIGEGQRGVSNYPLIDRHRGWFINLQDSNNPKQDGERIVTQGTLIGNTFSVTTRAFSKRNDPNESVCKPEEPGYGWLLSIDAMTGGSGKKSPYPDKPESVEIGDVAYHLIGLRFDGTLSAISFVKGPYALNFNKTMGSGKDTQLGEKQEQNEMCLDSETVEIDFTSSKRSVGPIVKKIGCVGGATAEPRRIYLRKRF